MLLSRFLGAKLACLSLGITLLAFGQKAIAQSIPETSLPSLDTEQTGENLATSAQIPQRWESNLYVPDPNIGKPETQSAGTRGCPIPIQLLVPKIPQVDSDRQANLQDAAIPFGVTASAYPNFFFLVETPQPNPILPCSLELKPSDYLLQFSLLDPTQDRVLYRVIFPLQSWDRIMSLSLPEIAGIAPLKLQKNYAWSITIFDVDETSNRLSFNNQAKGWIRRISPPPELKSSLEEASTQKQGQLYARAEIWYDALANLARVYRAEPDNPNVIQDWQRLLQAADFNELTETPLFTLEEAP